MATTVSAKPPPTAMEASSRLSAMVEQALGSIKASVTVVGIDSDHLFPPPEQKFLAEHIPGAEYFEISSNFGHDGFLLEFTQLEQILKPILDRL